MRIPYRFKNIKLTERMIRELHIKMLRDKLAFLSDKERWLLDAILSYMALQTRRDT